MVLFHIFLGTYIAYGLAETPPNIECSPDFIVRLNGDCSKFDICTNGSWITAACVEGEVFDPYSNTCSDGTGCIGCEKKINDPDNCRGFFTCEGSRRVWGSCNETQIFDSDSGECVKMESEQQCITERQQQLDKLKSILAEELEEIVTIPQIITEDIKPVPKNIKVEQEDTKALEVTTNLSNEITILNQSDLTSCRKGVRKAIPGSCSKYLRCNRFGAYVPKRCFWLYQFNAHTLRCQFLYSPSCVNKS